MTPPRHGCPSWEQKSHVDSRHRRSTATCLYPPCTVPPSDARHHTTGLEASFPFLSHFRISIPPPAHQVCGGADDGRYICVETQASISFYPMTSPHVSNSLSCRRVSSSASHRRFWMAAQTRDGDSSRRDPRARRRRWREIASCLDTYLRRRETGDRWDSDGDRAGLSVSPRHGMLPSPISACRKRTTARSCRGKLGNRLLALYGL